MGPMRAKPLYTTSVKEVNKRQKRISEDATEIQEDHDEEWSDEGG